MLVDESGRAVVGAAGRPRRADGAAWTNDDFPELKGHGHVLLGTLDWYEEDEQVFAHARRPYHRVDTLRSSRRVRGVRGRRAGGEQLRPLLLFETCLPTRYYLPFADVRTELLTASETVSYCPYKGKARYWSHPAVADVAWSYPDPIPENPKIRDLLCFYNERVDLVIDGVPQERPLSPLRAESRPPRHAVRVDPTPLPRPGGRRVRRRGTPGGRRGRVLRRRLAGLGRLPARPAATSTWPRSWRLR